MFLGKNRATRHASSSLVLAVVGRTGRSSKTLLAEIDPVTEKVVIHELRDALSSGNNLFFTKMKSGSSFVTLDDHKVWSVRFMEFLICIGRRKEA